MGRFAAVAVVPAHPAMAGHNAGIANHAGRA